MHIQVIYKRLFTYIKESLHELKRVVWPTRKQAITHSIAVVVMSIAVAAFLAGLDLIFSFGVQQLLQVKR
ncbi:preprotein translocase subunit SecE [Candidatus Uhrbacteria bacterium]|nr:preprotein translocase subunit SecE [Candidatus Uhrbacteria bacterium]